MPFSEISRRETQRIRSTNVHKSLLYDGGEWTINHERQ